MTRIVQYQIQVSEPVALFGFERAKGNQRRRARRNRPRRRDALGRRLRDLNHAARRRYSIHRRNIWCFTY
jgi:hypothetical protein